MTKLNQIFSKKIKEQKQVNKRLKILSNFLTSNDKISTDINEEELIKRGYRVMERLPKKELITMLATDLDAMIIALCKNINAL